MLVVAKTQTRGPKATAITDPPAFTIIVFDISHAFPIVTERSHLMPRQSFRWLSSILWHCNKRPCNATSPQLLRICNTLKLRLFRYLAAGQLLHHLKVRLMRRGIEHVGIRARAHHNSCDQDRGGGGVRIVAEVRTRRHAASA